jgi:hypothetical protein
MIMTEVNKYKCYDCGKIFESEGQVKEYTDAIYGPCSKRIAICPDCGEESLQIKVHAGKSKKGSDAPPCGKYDSCSCCGG